MTAGTLARVFKGSSEAAYQQMLLREKTAERERRERRDDLDNKSAELMEFAVAMISSTEASEFRIELDHYDAATIEALQRNEMELTRVEQKLDEMFAKAYALPDGRRVFKTEDGLRVFDENGQELDGSIIDPDMIEDFRPRWEPVKDTIDRRDALATERAEILDYQEKLDEARQRLDDGDLTREEFDNLRETLKADMPEAVRTQIPELQEANLSVTPEVPTVSEDLAISADMIPSAFKPG